MWNLPGVIDAGDVLYLQDKPRRPYYSGFDIPWNTGGSGWAMIVDERGVAVDFAVWGYSRELSW